MVAMPLVPRERPIRLSITSPELVLEGRFDHWVPMASENSSPEEGAIQVLFDTTGVRRTGDEDADLFSFTGKTVERIAPLAFVVKGTIKQGDAQQRIKIVVQAPAPHTPFVAITFSMDPEKFPEAWHEVAAALQTRTVSEAAIAPRAWLRAPVVATT